MTIHRVWFTYSDDYTADEILESIEGSICTCNVVSESYLKRDVKIVLVDIDVGDLDLKGVMNQMVAEEGFYGWKEIDIEDEEEPESSGELREIKEYLKDIRLLVEGRERFKLELDSINESYEEYESLVCELEAKYKSRYTFSVSERTRLADRLREVEDELGIKDDLLEIKSSSPPLFWSVLCAILLMLFLLALGNYYDLKERSMEREKALLHSHMLYIQQAEANK